MKFGRAPTTLITLSIQTVYGLLQSDDSCSAVPSDLAVQRVTRVNNQRRQLSYARIVDTAVVRDDDYTI